MRYSGLLVDWPDHSTIKPVASQLPQLSQIKYDVGTGKNCVFLGKNDEWVLRRRSHVSESVAKRQRERA